MLPLAVVLLTALLTAAALLTALTGLLVRLLTLLIIPPPLVVLLLTVLAALLLTTLSALLVLLIGHQLLLGVDAQGQRDIPANVPFLALRFHPNRRFPIPKFAKGAPQGVTNFGIRTRESRQILCALIAARTRLGVAGISISSIPSFNASSTAPMIAGGARGAAFARALDAERIGGDRNLGQFGREIGQIDRARHGVGTRPSHVQNRRYRR